MRNIVQLALVHFWLLGTVSLFSQVDVTNEGKLFISDGQLVHIGGNLTNKSSDLVNRGEVGLTGNFWNEAPVYNPNSGIYRFYGNTEQTLFLFDSLAFFEMEINNPLGLTLAGDHHAEVFEHLYFEDGLIRSNIQNMLSFQPFTTYSDASDFSHIEGPMLRTGESDFIFPVGKGGLLRAPGVSGLNSQTVFLAEYFNEAFFSLDTDFTLNKVSDQEYWEVDLLEGNSTARVSIPYDENSGLVDDLTKLRMAYFDENDLWTRREATSDGASPLLSLISEDFLDQFGFFTTAEVRSYQADVIEISLVQTEECEIIVNWVVPPDYPVVLYEIERSLDSLTFEKIGETPGDTIPNLDYKLMWFADMDLYTQSRLFYRMKITFPDGTTAYTNTASIENKCIFVDCQIFPNPVSTNNNLNIRVESLEEQEMVLQIFSVPGRLLLKQTLELKAGRHDYEIMTKELNLPAAPYFLYIGPRKSMKFIVINE